MRTIGIIKNVAGALLVTVTTALALTACHPDDDPGTGGTDGDMITVSRLEVGIESIGATTGTRAGDAGTRAEGVYAGVKTEFVDGEVLHLYVSAKVSGHLTNELATATYTAGTTDGTAGTWSISPALMLPENAVDMSIIAFYDGKKTEYKEDDSEQFFIDLIAATTGVTIVSEGGNPTPVSDNACDALIASNADDMGGSITLGANGALTIKLAHASALIRLGKVENRLSGKEIKAVEAVVYEYGMGISHYRPISLVMTNADGGYAGAEAFSYVFYESAPYVLTSFIVTINDKGSTGTGGDEVLIIPVPDATGTLGSGNPIKDSEGKPVTGQPVLSGKKYTYHLVLAPGKLTATLDGNDDNLQWTDKGQLLTTPTGYIPLYNAEDLKKIGTETDYPLSGNYILMADIDLATAANGGGGDDANWTPIGTFTGRFNGNGHTITGMRVNTNGNVGFFGYIKDAVIYNLHFEGASVMGTEGNNNAGTLVGYANKGSIALCSATGCTVSGKKNVGGLVGYCDGLHLTRCYAIDCTVTSNTNNCVGGLIGQNEVNYYLGLTGRLTACYTAGCTVTITVDNDGRTIAGGLVGYTSGDLYGCYALYAAVTATGGSDNYSGALAGHLNGAQIISCYATNNTSNTGNSANNMLIVHIDNYPTITGCISPLKDPNGVPDAPSETLNSSGYSIIYRGTEAGYAPLVKKSDNSDIAERTGVRTVVVNTTDGNATEYGSSSADIPPGGIYVVSRTWKAAKIWKIDTNDADKKKNAPFINWSYDGEK